MDIQIDALYFQPHESGVPYAVVEQRVVYPDFKNRFGFRVKVGTDVSHDCWNVQLAFTHYHARSTDEVAGKEFFPTWVHPAQGLTGFAESVRSRWRLHLGFLDALLSKRWCVSKCLELTPLWGLRFAGVRHKLRTIYRGGTLIETEDNISMKNKFWGLGPEFGVVANWKVNSWLGIYTRGAFSLLLGEFYLHQDEDGAFTMKFFDEFYSVQKVFEMGIGLKVWYRCLSLHVGFEEYLLPSQNQLVQFVDGSMPGKFIGNLGDLSFGGLSFGLRLEY